jgi:hypothetical protein
LELARNAQTLFRSRGKEERAVLLGFILPGSTLDQDGVVPAFKPPFDLIHRMAQETKQAAPDPEAACPTLLPRANTKRTRAEHSPR